MDKFKNVVNGYSYRLFSPIECDGRLCTAEFEVKRYGIDISNIDEINRYIEEFITDFMKNHFKWKLKGYYPLGCLRQIRENAYELSWQVECKISKIVLLKRYCEGHEVKITSGNLTGQRGRYLVKHEGSLFKRKREYIKTDSDEFLLKPKSFRFIDGNIQLSYDDIMGEL